MRKQFPRRRRFKMVKNKIIYFKGIWSEAPIDLFHLNYVKQPHAKNCNCTYDDEFDLTDTNL